MTLAAWAYLLNRDLQAAVRRAGGADRLRQAGVGQLVELLGVSPVQAAELAAIRDRNGRPPRDTPRGPVDFIEPSCADWPRGLGALPDPPFGLFVCGRREALGQLAARPVVAVVGSRHASAQGNRLAYDIACGVAERGAVVVSGLAHGIDTSAHRGALAAGGVTIAVLGCGIDVEYPRRNRQLAQRIAADGALLSEYWPGTTPAPWRFPARNRIVAGIADLVAVIEAGARSGALITADFALELGRPVLAVPGWPTLAGAAGGNGLLRAGAGLLECVEDVVAELPTANWCAADEIPQAPADGVCAQVLGALADAPLALDRLVEMLGRSAAEVGAALAMLEVDGRVVRGEGQRYWATLRPVGTAPNRSGQP